MSPGHASDHITLTPMSAPPRRHCGAQNTTGSCSLQSVPNTGNVCTALDTGALAMSVSALPWHSLATLTLHWHCLVPASSSLNQYRGQCCWSGHSTWTASDSQRPQEPVLVVIRGHVRTGWDRQVVLAGYCHTAISSSCCVVLTLDMLHLFLFYELFMMILLILVKTNSTASTLQDSRLQPTIICLIKTKIFWL